MCVARDFSPWSVCSRNGLARRANDRSVRPTGENRKEDIEFQGLKSLAIPARRDSPYGRRSALHHERRSDQAETTLPENSRLTIHYPLPYRS